VKGNSADSGLQFSGRNFIVITAKKCKIQVTNYHTQKTNGKLNKPILYDKMHSKETNKCKKNFGAEKMKLELTLIRSSRAKIM